MKVNKRELVERTFIPYEIVITVESEEEHNYLNNDVSRVEAEMPKNVFFWGKAKTLRDLFRLIKSHTK